MKSVLLTAASLALLPTLAFAAESRTLDAAPFHAVSASSGIHVQLTSGIIEQSVTAKAPSADALRDFRYEVRNGELRLWIDHGLFNIFHLVGSDIEVWINVPSIDRLEASSGAELNASDIEADNLSVEVSSGARATVRNTAAKSYALESSSGGGFEIGGSCETADAEVSSGAYIVAKDLDCKTVNAEASSGAWVDITARESLSAEASTGGKIGVFGAPRVEHQETSTGGSIEIQPHE